MSKEFKLSATLYGHSLDVRSVKVTPNNDIISGSRDKTAKLWRPNSLNGSYNEVMTYREQKNFVGAVLYLDPVPNFPDGLIVTGGYDNIILIYKPSEPFATYTLKEHTGTVSCLSKGNETGTFFSGSWDSSAKYWIISSINKSTVTFNGHNAAIWSAIQISDGRVLTASADKTVGVWTPTGQNINFLIGHSDCVRGILDLPELNYFISVSNDASIKVWSYTGENVDTYYGHTNYIYSIARCKSGGDNCFVTSDEDRTVRYWQDGQNTQTFSLPAQSVWSVDCMTNGDVVTGSSDGQVRIFTQNEDRMAEESALTKFNEEVLALTQQSTQEIGGVKVTDLPGREALFDHGKKPGQMKMIREGGGVVAYTWVEDGDNSHWEKVGDVLGGTDKDSSGKTVFEGKSYDFVFSVDVEDGKPALKLPYNKGEDVYQVANEFLTKNMLPPTYLEQIVDFILTNSKDKYAPPTTNYVDPFTGASRYTPQGDLNNRGVADGFNLDPFTGGSSYTTSQGGNSQTSLANSGANTDPFTGGSSYTTVTQAQNKSGECERFFPLSAYRTFDIGNPQIVLNKLKEFNEEAKGHNTFLDEKQLERLVDLCDGPPADPNSLELLFKLLDWPDDYLFPVLDVIRLAVRHKQINEIISSANRSTLIDKLKYCISDNCRVANNTIVALRVLSNLLCHDQGENLIYKNHMDILENITSLAQQNKNGQVALSTLLLNMVIMAIKKNDYMGISILAEVIPDISTKLNDPESQFRLYVALGTLLLSEYGSKKEIKLKISSSDNFMSIMKSHSSMSSNELETKRMKCVKQIQDIL
ncbi:unnamed protein product [Brassicogethes aeneus]|uniref:Phospholipase A-2-activating protein n=1 Tax=Brassicogethes aeneus TaxID=1431903 RepID=A0A9P0B642_BRAAE|nr:unnamed protein product [Brassicogethes aeneus]